MKKIKLIDEPGFVYDIIYTFVFHFNKDICVSKLESQGYSYKEDNLPLISKELYPFFYLKDDERCFVLEHYYESNVDLFDGDYGFSILYKAMSNKETLKLNLIKYYFPQLNEKEQSYCSEHIEAISEQIRKSEYSDSLKCLLLTFFVETDAIINILSEQLFSVNLWLKDIYEEKTTERNTFQENFEFEILKEHLNTLNIAVEKGRIWIIPCVLDENCFKVYETKNIVVLIVGINYFNYVQHMLNRENEINLNSFGTVLSEKNRIDILDLLLKKNEITIGDLEQDLRLTGTNAYYHLNIMIKAKVIKTRTHNKKVYYSIERNTFRHIAKLLEKYS